MNDASKVVPEAYTESDPVNTSDPDDPSDPVNPSNPTAGKKYIVVSDDNYALTTNAGQSYSNNETDVYHYSGLAGVAYTSNMTVTADMIWEVEAATGNAIYLKNGNNYLNGSYVANSVGGYDGSVSLGAKQDTLQMLLLFVSSNIRIILLQTQNHSLNHSQVLVI